MPTIDREQLVCDIVLEHPETAAVFRAHDIDFCCGGRVTLQDACATAGLDAERVIEELVGAAERLMDDDSVDVRAFSTPTLVAHIISQHHGYLRRALPIIEGMARKVCAVHGETRRDMVELAKVVSELSLVLNEHLDYEERVVFPSLMRAGYGAPGQRVVDELAAMGRDHLEVALALERIHVLTNRYTLPDWACTAHRTLYASLAALEKDIHQHVHLENNVLLPRFVSVDPEPRRTSATLTH